ncbi:hypothetical protein AAFF_G00440710 [Aldrovandia affinis]|uniref:Protein-tyrosine-phosphatase n=1 Tax=Aldrovandia affinis TaxID=143900 RepID=A0AAD7S7Q4_9TELE|nr:hypothetical protein AAFF_G00440710 [Aldrovandia affinis]
MGHHVGLPDHPHSVPKRCRCCPEQGTGLPKGHHPHHQCHPDTHMPCAPGGGVPPSARLCDHFESVAERIHSNRTGGTLVHCAAGMSRSPALVMAYLMRYKGVTLRQAHDWVRDCRPFIRPNAGFWRQLLDYEKNLYGKNTVKMVATPLGVLPESKASEGESQYCLGL